MKLEKNNERSGVGSWRRRMVAVLAAVAVSVGTIVAAAQPGPFGAALQQLIGAAPSGFAPIRGNAQPRNPGDESTFFDARVVVPGYTECDIEVDDEGVVSPQYSCLAYRGSAELDAMNAYQRASSQLRDFARGNGGRAEESTRTSNRDGIPAQYIRTRYGAPNGAAVTISYSTTMYPNGRISRLVSLAVKMGG